MMLMKETKGMLICIYVILYVNNDVSARKMKRGYVYNRPKPNIIFVMADDLDVTLGSPEVMVKTNLLLRDKGVSFTNAFTTSPLCCPSRSSILTGRYAHNHHVNSNNKNCSGPEWINGPEKETFGTLMQNAGYKTAYFGKYLNNYDGKRVPLGWDNWQGLVRNSRYYDYSVNINGKIVKYGSNYKKHYFTDVMSRNSVNYFKRHIRTSSQPLFMVVSMAAPHGPEDGAPQYQHKFENATAPRFPSYNFTSHDKHWIIRTTPPLDNTRAQFTDVLHRKRLQTLLSLDDAVERLYLMLFKTRQLQNTYIVFSSDHGYHLGQFNQVKGKSQPYESDIRIPLYISGPKISRGVKVQDIALNIDLLPTFLDIAGARPLKRLDGTSVMDVAVGKVVDLKKRKVMKPIWRDSFLVERGKLQSIRNSTGRSPVQRLVFHSVEKVQRICSRKGFPKPPCDSEKKLICYAQNGTLYLERCKITQKQQQCLCSTKGSTVPTDETSYLLATLERQFERLKRRIKRHGVKDVLPAPTNLTTVEEKVVQQQTNLDRKIAKSLQRIEQWRKEREKIFQNRVLKKKIKLSLREKVSKATNTAHVCSCTEKSAKKMKTKNKKGYGGRDKNCFHMDKHHWKRPPLWTGPSFTACTNSPNSSYWCLRTINTTHNFLYCEFVTGFHEYFDLNKDPYQLNNTYSSLSSDDASNLHKQTVYMKTCKSSRGCFLRAGENLNDRRDTLRKMRRYNRRKRHGILTLGDTDERL